jgi:hypothetical protein
VPPDVLLLLQTAFTLKSLLEAAEVPPPYILVGHGRGGQMALQVRRHCSTTREAMQQAAGYAQFLKCQQWCHM